ACSTFHLTLRVVDAAGGFRWCSPDSSRNHARMTRLRGISLTEDRFDLGDGVLAIRRPSGVEELVEAGTPVSALYWATPWPSGCALAVFVAGLPLEGRKVLELGAGLGLPALAAARAGAEVLATDNQADAMALLRQNARRALGRRIHTLRADLA